MSATTQLLDKWKKVRSIASDNAAGVALGIHRATISGWRHNNRQAEAHVLAQMARDLGEDPGAWLALVESERARSEADRKAWRDVAKRLGAVAAVLVAMVGGAPGAQAKAPEAGSHFAIIGSLYIMSLLKWRQPDPELAVPLPLAVVRGTTRQCRAGTVCSGASGNRPRTHFPTTCPTSRASS